MALEFPVLSKPIPIIEADNSYQYYAVWFSASPRFDEGKTDMVLCAQLKPYRILKDGALDFAPEALTKTVNVGSLDAVKQADTVPLQDDIAKLVQTLTDVIAKSLMS